MAVQYQIVLRSATGTALKIVDDFTSLDYARVVNAVGALTLILPDRFDVKLNLYLFDLFNQPDNRLEVWRQVDGGLPYLDAEAVWFIVYAERILSNTGERLFQVIAEDANTILSRRYILYAAGTPQATKSQAQDDMMKVIVNENLGVNATDTTRDLSAYLAVQPYVSLAPGDSLAFAWQNVLSTLQQIANNAASATQATPTYLAFDVVYRDSSTLEFRTYVNWRGVDHRSGVGPVPLNLSAEASNFYSANLAFDYRPERNTIIATGNGVGSARATATAQDTTRSSISPFHRIEFVHQAAGIALAAATLQAEANAGLRSNRYQRTFTAIIVHQKAAQYGVHFGFGDVVPVSLANTTISVRITGIHVSIVGGQESVEMAFAADTLL